MERGRSRLALGELLALHWFNIAIMIMAKVFVGIVGVTRVDYLCLW